MSAIFTLQMCDFRRYPYRLCAARSVAILTLEGRDFRPRLIHAHFSAALNVDEGLTKILAMTTL